MSVNFNFNIDSIVNISGGNMGVEVVLTVLGMVSKYGIEAVIEIFKTWNENEPVTVERLKEYEMKFQDPHSYFYKPDEADGEMVTTGATGGTGGSVTE